MTDKQTLINMLLVRIKVTPMPRLYDWEEKQIVIEALKLLKGRAIETLRRCK